MLNNITLAGRLVSDAELKISDSGSMVCIINLANNRKNGEQEEVTFIEAVALGKYAKALAPHLKKGVAIDVVGELAQDRWSSDDGKTHYKHKIVARKIGFRESKGDNGGSNE